MTLENPVDGSASLKPDSTDPATREANAQSEILPGDSATTKAEKVERNGADSTEDHGNDRPQKKARLNGDSVQLAADADAPSDTRNKGVAPIKAEFIIPHTPGRPQASVAIHDDDAAESKGKDDGRENGEGKRGKGKKQGGQNKARKFGSSNDEMRLCSSVATLDEFSARQCRFGNKCKFEHDLRKYLAHGKREDLTTLGGICPVFTIRGWCNAGWKCRFASSHSEEKTHPDGRKELVLLNKGSADGKADDEDEGPVPGVVNAVDVGFKVQLRKKNYPLPKSDLFNEWLEKRQGAVDKVYAASEDKNPATADLRANYIEAPLRPSEKRRIYYGPETPILAPLTTQGNLPFRRLCVSLGAQVTWSEMAMGMPLLQGEKGEWALLKAHESEMTPPKYSPTSVLAGYDNAKDIKFGAQIAANKPWLATKTVEALTSLCPQLRAIDLNCGCPIDLVFRQGAGSALMDTPGRMEKTLRGMNVVSGEVPITVKIRMGTRDAHPTADKLVERLVLGGGEAREVGEGPAGVAAITLHGRSRQQRYTRSANWSYIAECSALVSRLQKKADDNADTVREVDARDQASSNDGKVFFIGNGDCYSHEEYYSHLKDAKVDSVMVARGALVKPWIFEEIEQGQYLDKSSSQRLEYVEKFARFGMEYWGSDEVGVGITRRFLLEWLSFSCRYIPVAMLEHLPPRLGDRPPPFKGRDDLETLMCSPNYKDWIKISEMFLGPATKDFQFQPKHKSNSYEIEAEG